MSFSAEEVEEFKTEALELLEMTEKSCLISIKAVNTSIPAATAALRRAFCLFVQTINNQFLNSNDPSGISFAEYGYMSGLVAFIALLITSFAQAQTDTLPTVVHTDKYKSCANRLLPVATPIEPSRVVDLPDTAPILDGALQSNGKTYAVAERQLFVNDPRFEVADAHVITSAFTLLDHAGNKLLSAQHLKAAADAYLIQNSKGRVELMNFDIMQFYSEHDVVVTPDGRFIAFALQSSTGSGWVFLYDIASGKAVPLFENFKGSNQRPRLTIRHERFLIVDAKSKYVIYDLANAKSLHLRNSFLKEAPDSKAGKIDVSEDGKTVFVSIDKPSNKSAHDYRNFVLNLDYDWSELQGSEYELSSLGKIKKFSGLVVAQSPDLRRFIVDKTNNEAHQLADRNTNPYPYIAPELHTVELQRGRYVKKPLAEWTAILDKVKDLAQRGTILTVSGVQGEMDDRYFALNLEFMTRAIGPDKMLSVTQNLICLWNIEAGSIPVQFTSGAMNTENDAEHDGGHLQSKGYSRILQTKLLKNGTIFVVRTTSRDKPQGLAEVVFKVAELNTNGFVELREYSTGNINLNPHGVTTGLGVSRMQLSPDGQLAAFYITNNGSKIIDISKARVKGI